MAAGGSQPTDSQTSALAALCESYWYPCFAFVRRQGYDVEEAQDLTQGFFVNLLDKNYVGDADRRRGKFRTFLLSSLKNFLANQRDHARAIKRGGGKQILSLDFVMAEERYRHEAADTMTADRIYERRWAMTVLDHALARLRADYSAAGKQELFDQLKESLTSHKTAAPYAQIALKLNMNEGATKTAIHRLRKRYRDIIKDEIRSTLAPGDDVEDELGQLLAALNTEK